MTSLRVCAFVYHFTGKERDTESGNDYFGARYYNSGTGRWISPDTDYTLTRILPNPQRWNRYAYVINNPLILFDPDGLADWYIFRPLVPKDTAMSPQWKKAINAANKRGDTVHMFMGSQASGSAYDAALSTKDAIVMVLSHGGINYGVSLFDSVSTGKNGLVTVGTEKVIRDGRHASIDITVTAHPDVNIQAQQVIAVGCETASLADEYPGTQFIGVWAGDSGEISTWLGSSIGAAILQAGGGQDGVDAATQQIQASHLPMDQGASMDITDTRGIVDPIVINDRGKGEPR